MPRYGRISQQHYEELHPKLKRILDIAIQHWDNSIIDAGRTKREQTINVQKGVSKTMKSKHLVDTTNTDPTDDVARAMDTMPYPINWIAITKGLNALKKADPEMQAAEAFAYIGFIQGIAAALGIKVHSGVDWDSDRDFSDHSFLDMPHTELDPSEE